MRKVNLLFLCFTLLVACTMGRKTTSSAGGAGEGSSFEKAVVIREKTETSGVKAEYNWLREHYPGYKSQGQALVHHDGKPYDIITIKTAEGETIKVHFDISNFFGKF